MQKINDTLSFYSKKKISSIPNYTECLEKYSTNFEKEITLKTETPIFLDTNVLLRYYNISFTAREKLSEFIDQNKSRIYLTEQVQYEFLKNREDAIQKFFEQVTNKIPKDFSDVVNKMKHFLDTHKTVLKDYPFVEAGIIKHQSEIEKLSSKLNETSEQKKKENVNLIVKDAFLTILNSCNLDRNLDEDEIKILKADFDTQQKNIQPESAESILNKTHLIFPGFGDIKQKPDNPYGDYIIFHEMMKFMFNEKEDVIFLTFDTTKGDWMTKNKAPYLHYIQNMYSNTNQLIYILDAERTLGDILNINIESLVSVNSDNDSISVESILNLIATNKIFEGHSKSEIDESIVNELIIGGYKTINEVENDLNRGINAFAEYSKGNGMKYATLGVLRHTLRIVNPNFVFSRMGGKLTTLKPETLEKNYGQYRQYVN